MCEEELALAAWLGIPIYTVTRGIEFKILPSTEESLSINLTPENESTFVGNPFRESKFVVLTLIGVTETFVKILGRRSGTFNTNFERSIDAIANLFGRSRQDMKDFEFATKAIMPIAVLLDP